MPRGERRPRPDWTREERRRRLLEHDTESVDAARTEYYVSMERLRGVYFRLACQPGGMRWLERVQRTDVLLRQELQPGSLLRLMAGRPLPSP